MISHLKRPSFLSTKGMTCGACVSNVENQLLSVDGVLTVSVSLMGKRGQVWDVPCLRSVSQLHLAPSLEPPFR